MTRVPTMTLVRLAFTSFLIWRVAAGDMWALVVVLTLNVIAIELIIPLIRRQR